MILGSPSSKFDNLNVICVSWNLKLSSLLFFGDVREDKLAAEKVGARFIAIGINTGAVVSYPDLNIWRIQL